MHRFTWDLRHPGPFVSEDLRGLYGIPDEDGPMAVPGRYQVRLSGDGWSETRSLEVLIDPRVEEDGVTAYDLYAQEGLNLRIRDAISEATGAALRVGTILDGNNGGQAQRQAEALWEELVTKSTGSYPVPKLIDQIGYLYDMTTRADQRPNRDAFERYDELRSQLDDVLQRVNRLDRAVSESGGS